MKGHSAVGLKRQDLPFQTQASDEHVLGSHSHALGAYSTGTRVNDVLAGAEGAVNIYCPWYIMKQWGNAFYQRLFLNHSGPINSHNRGKQKL